MKQFEWRLDYNQYYSNEDDVHDGGGDDDDNDDDNDDDDFYEVDLCYNNMPITLVVCFFVCIVLFDCLCVGEGGRKI